MDTHPLLPPDVAAPWDYAAHAREALDPMAWAYLAGGAADELTLRANRAAFDCLGLRGRVLAEVEGGHTALDLFGQRLAHPILLAPVAHQGLFHPEAERGTVLAAAAQEAVLTVGTLASRSLEELAALAQGPLWFQLYVQPDRAFTWDLVRRAEAAGYQAIVLTGDAPLAGIRNREARAGFRLPPHLSAVNLQGCRPMPEPKAGSRVAQAMEQAATWKDLEVLRSITRLPVILKGVLCAEDARQALDLGVDGIVVSNHGGRTLDTLPPTLAVLPGIVSALDGRIPVLLDGGIRRGTDVLKAMALGASAVLVGRAWVQGLAVAGPHGVAHVLRLLRDELEVAMALTGCRTLAEVGPHLLEPGA